MKTIILALCICVLIAGTASVALASWGDLLADRNGDFHKGFATSYKNWEDYGAVKWDRDNGQPKGSAVVPEYAWGLITNLVQVADDDWNPLLSKTQYELKAKVRIYPTEDIHFKIGWWDNVTTAPSATATPDHVLDLGNITDTCSTWKDVSYAGFLTSQPKWLSVRIEWNPELNQAADCHGWVDQVEFRAKCAGVPQNPDIPEPMSMVLGCLGLAAVAGVRRIRGR
jgi:hypothetical protein